MSYYGQPGSYPPQGGGYPPQPGYGQPPASSYYPSPGYPQSGGPVGMPDPYGGGYPPSSGGLPYPAQPPTLGFPTPDQFYGGGYPPQSSPYPPSQSNPYPPSQSSAYPPQQSGGIYPPLQSGGGGYPPQAAPSAYPPAGGGFGGYPPQPGYGQPGVPPTNGGGYGAPGGYAPPPSYGQPPGAGAPGGYQMGYGQPGGPMMGKLPEGQGTVRPKPNFDAEEDAKVLRKAMKGLGTDEKAIIDVLSARSNQQRMEIKNRFKTMYGKDLIKDIKSELSGHFEMLTIALLKSPVEYDCEELRAAMQGAGTDERCLIEILCTRSNSEIHAIKSFYKLQYGRDLEKDLISETSGHFRRLLVSLSTGNRIENQPVDYNRAKQDAQELYQAGEKRLGTDESKFNQILCSQSYEQLRAVFQEYRTLSKKGLDQVIKSEMSGDLENGMLAIYAVVENKHRFFAERLYHSMKGLGTKDRTLVRIVASRCEIDMVQIKQEFQRQYGKTLESFIEGDTSGDYKKMLLALVRGY